MAVTATADTIRIVDTTGIGGLSPGPCRPGRVDLDTGFVIEALCPRTGVERLRINVGEREDTVTADVPFPVRVIGGAGADRITTGPASDVVDGGQGDDVIDGGPAPDAIAAGDGNDVVRAVDGGASDSVACGPGIDAVERDDVDRPAADCEPGPPLPRADARPPALRVATAGRQRAARRVELTARTDEAVRVVVQAAMIIRSRDFPLRPGRGTIRSARGGTVTVRPALSARELVIARRGLANGFNVDVLAGVVATDAAGNSRLLNAPRIRLRR